MADVQGLWAGGWRCATVLAPILAGALLLVGLCPHLRAEPVELKPRVTLKAHEDEVLAVAFSPDGQGLATGGKDERLLLWDLKTDRYVRAFDHDSEISQIRWSSKSKLLIRGHSGPPVLVDPLKLVGQDLSDNLRLATTKDAAFTRNGEKILISVGRSITDPDDTPDTLLIWGVSEKQPSREFATGRAVAGLDGTLDGATVACQGEVREKDGYRAIVNVFDIATAKLVQTIEGERYQKTGLQSVLRFSPDGSSLLYRKSDRKFGVWDLAARKDRAEVAAPSEVDYVGCSPAGSFLAGAQGSKVLVWDARTAQLVYMLEGTGAPISAVDISSGARLVAAAAGNDVCVWALPCATSNDADLPPAVQPVQVWPPAAPDRGPLAGVPTSQPATRPADEDDPAATATVASIRQMGRPSGIGEAPGAEDAKLDAPEVRPYAVLRSRGKAVLTANFSSDGRTLVTAQSLSPVRLWDVATGQPRPSTDRDFDARQLALAPDGHTVAAVDTQGRLLLEDLAGDKWRQVSGAEKNSALLFDAVHGQYLCGHWDGSVSFWKLASVNDGTGDKLVRELQGGGKILRLAISPDGTLLAASGLSRAAHAEDQQAPTLEVTVWDIKTGEVIASATGGQYEFVPAVGFANNGRTLLYRQNARELIAWDVKGAKRLRMISLPSPVRLAAFSPDGSCIATLAAQDERHDHLAAVRILDIATGKVLWDLTGIAPTDMVRCVGFSPDGRTVVANSGKVALLWSLPEKGTPKTRPAP